MQYLGVHSTVKDLLEIKRGIKDALDRGEDPVMPETPEPEISIKIEGQSMQRFAKILYFCPLV